MSFAAKGLKKVTLELGGKSPNYRVRRRQHGRCRQRRDFRNLRGHRTDLHRWVAALGASVDPQFLLRSPCSDGVDRTHGQSMNLDTQVGPVTTRPQYEKILNYIGIAQKEGAQLALGGKPAARPECDEGWFIEPTIFSGVNNQMRIAREEVFGPVLSIIPFRDDDEAIAIANDSPYGLAAGVWTTSIKRAIRASERLEAGSVWVNTYRAVSYMSPFGGYKRSGLGRENGQDAIFSYLQTKSVWISTAEEVPNPFVMR